MSEKPKDQGEKIYSAQIYQIIILTVDLLNMMFVVRKGVIDHQKENVSGS